MNGLPGAGHSMILPRDYSNNINGLNWKCYTSLEKANPVPEWPYSNFITGTKGKQGNFIQFTTRLKSEGGLFDPDEWAQLFADAGAKYAGPVADSRGFNIDKMVFE